LGRGLRARKAFNDQLGLLYQDAVKLRPSDRKKDRIIAELLSIFSILGAAITISVVLGERPAAP
jgi:hypothetical protein